MEPEWRRPMEVDAVRPKGPGGGFGKGQSGDVYSERFNSYGNGSGYGSGYSSADVPRPGKGK